MTFKQVVSEYARENNLEEIDACIAILEKYWSGEIADFDKDTEPSPMEKLHGKFIGVEYTSYGYSLVYADGYKDFNDIGD